MLSQLTAAVAGQGVFYYITMGSILLVLALSANTAFADFPRLCRAVAEDGYLPPASPRAEGAWCTRKASGCSRCCAAGC